MTVEDIVCKSCGTHASSGEAFCGGCGAFLEWEGERITDDAAPAAEPTNDVDSEPKVGAVSPPVAAAAATTTTDNPVAVQPAVPKERPRPQAVPKASRKLDPGAIYCGTCGEGNSPERRFCRRCGASLDAPAPVAAKVPWWRRIFGGGGKAGNASSASPGGTAAAPAGAAAATGAGGAAAMPKAAAGSSPSMPKPPAMPKVPSMPKAPAGAPTYHPPQVTMPRTLSAANLPKKSGKAGKVVGVVVILAVVVGAVDPTLRNKVTGLFAKASPVALAGIPVASEIGKCAAPVLGPDNSTLYWYTTNPPARQVGLARVPAEQVTVDVASTFTGNITSIVFTPLLATPGSTLAGTSPYPLVLRVTAAPAGTVLNITLKNPLVLESVPVSIPRPTSITLRMLSADPGAAAGTCAEVGIVFHGKNG